MNQTKLFITICIVSFSTVLFGQVTDLEKSIRDKKALETAKKDTIVSKWKYGGMFGLNASQASFTNWAAGGENSVGGNATANVFMNFQGNSSSWENTLDLGYGLLWQETQGLMKTDDKIDFSSKFGQKAAKHWYYAAMLNFKTQFSNGYDYTKEDQGKVSTFMAPGYLIGAIGMDYKPIKYLTVFISPITSKLTFVTDDSLSNIGAYGVDKGEWMRAEYGGYLRIGYNQSFLKNSITVISKLDLFSNYTDKPQNVDVTWENIISFKINKYISANINTVLIYDDDIKTKIPTGTKDADGKDKFITKGPKIQFKEVIGIGLSYNF